MSMIMQLHYYKGLLSAFLTLSIVATTSVSATHGRSMAQAAPPVTEPPGFVVRKGSRLQLNGAPYFFVGANFYPAMVGAAAGGSYRSNVTAVLQSMQSNGMTVLRTWAFNDGPVWQGLQTAPGFYDDRVFREGLDWLLVEVAKYNIRLVLTLTNQYPGYGGEPQYVKWAGLKSMNDFYTSPAIRAAFKANVRTMLTRKNSITGSLYLNDPNILAWELANELANFGDGSGNSVQDWLLDMAPFVKSIDPNHLLSGGGSGSFGMSTPQFFNNSGYAPNIYGFPLNGGSPYPFTEPTCSGEDFSRNGAIPEIDLLSFHLYPDLAITCSFQCQLDWARDYLLVHIEAARIVGKPLLLGEYNKLPPISQRTAFVQMVLSTLDGAFKGGEPVAEYDSYSIYTDPALGLLPPLKPYAAPTSFALQSAQFAEYANWNESLTCNTNLAAGPNRTNFVDTDNEVLKTLALYAAAA